MYDWWCVVLWSRVRRVSGTCTCTSTLPSIHYVVVCSIDPEDIPFFRSFHRSFTRRDRLLYLDIDVHRVLSVRPAELVKGLVLDVEICITCRTIVPLILVVSVMNDYANSRLEFRVAPDFSMSSREYNWKKDAIRLDNDWNRLLGQRCHESIDAVEAFMSLNPLSYSWIRSNCLESASRCCSWFRRNYSCFRISWWSSRPCCISLMQCPSVSSNCLHWMLMLSKFIP